MGMVVQHNMTAANANRNLGVTCGNLAKSTEKLSSGYKINRAGDNAAGLAISEKMRGQIRGLDKASANAEDGISMIQTAEGALTETHSILQRMRELAVQSSSDTNTDDDRTQIQNEIDQLTQEVDRIATTTEFNTKKLLDGSKKGSVSAKDGSCDIEGTFSNSTVTASISSETVGKTKFTDAIRIEMTKDYEPTQSVSETDVNAYLDLVGQNALIDSAVKAIISGNSTATAPSDDELKGYVDATKEGLKGVNAVGTSAGLYSTQTNAWATVAGHISANGSNAISYKDETGANQSVNASETADNVKTAVRNLLDKKAANLATMETKYKDINNTNISGGTIGDIIAATTTAKNNFDNVKTEATKAGITDASTEATAYKDAIVTAMKSGKTYDDAINDDSVMDARKALFNKYNDTSGFQATGTAGAGCTIDGATFTTANKKSDVAAAAYDAYVKYAGDLAKAEITQDNAEEQLKSDAKKAGELVKNVDYTVQDLFGNESQMKVASKLDTNQSLIITLDNGDGNEKTTITIANADKLKAGDTLTITAKERVDTEPAATGKDAFRLQVGANAGQEVSLGINSMKASDLHIVQTKKGVEGKALDVTTQAGASLAIEAYDMAIQSVSTERAKMGAMQNRLEHTIANLDTSSENLQSAESSLRDTNMAEEMTRFSKNNILQQAGQSMLAQANQSTQGVLSLLG